MDVVNTRHFCWAGIGSLKQIQHGTSIWHGTSIQHGTYPTQARTPPPPSVSSFKRVFTLRSVWSLNNPQNSEMKICEKYEVDMLKIIIIFIGYTLNNFTTHITIL